MPSSLLCMMLAVLGACSLLPTTAGAQTPADPLLPPEIAGREPRVCALPPRQVNAGVQSLWNANLWPGGVVPYEFDANTTTAEQAAMRQAMNVLEAVAYVQFVVRAGQANYVHIKDSTGNNSFVGMMGGGQIVNIFNWNFRYKMCHELMHALGVWHEQSRPDRDQYITVAYGNIAVDQTQCGGSCAYAFDIEQASIQGPYDFDSVMHYGQYDFSSNGQPTIVVLPPNQAWQNLIGQRTHLSSGDIAGLVSRYGATTCPVFTQQPTGAATTTGQTVTFAVTATGVGTPTYQWRRNAVNLTDDGRITGAATATLTIRNVSQADAGSYTCAAANVCGSTLSSAASLTVGCAVWAQSSTSGPSARYARAAFDSNRNVAVMFGGYGGTLHDDTWEWNRTSWVPRITGTTHPSARTYHAMAFDNRLGFTLLFSGLGPQLTSVPADTWKWDGAAWTQLPVAGPTARYHSAMAYDSGRGVMVLYGGLDSGTTATTALSDTWEWNGTTWSQRQASGQLPSPGPRCYHAMAYDSTRGVTVLFGGGNDLRNHVLLGDTWEWDGSTWVQRSVTGPSARALHTMVFDDARNTTVVFGGGSDLSSDSTLHETWEWNGSNWTQRIVAPSPGRYLHAMWFDTAARTSVIFGGWGDTAIVGDTWTLGPDPSIQTQPASVVNCALGTTPFSVIGVGTGALTYHWQAQDSGVWVNLTDGSGVPITSAISGQTQGSTTNQLTVGPLTPQLATNPNAVQFRCVVTNTCGSVTSNPATLTIVTACNLADIVSIGGGTAPGGGACPDGLLTGDDFNAFIAAFANGEPLADIVSIGGEPPPDGLITGDDFNAFVAAFANGCP